MVIKRKYPEGPIVGVASVIFVGHAVLLARRSQEPAKGQWSLPGGVVELGETLLGAIKREIWEETSVNIEVGGLIDVFDRIVHDPQGRVKYHYVLVDFWGQAVSGHPRPGSDITEIRLVPVDEIEALEIAPELKETILRAIRMREQKSEGEDGHYLVSSHK